MLEVVVSPEGNENLMERRWKWDGKIPCRPKWEED